MYVCSLPVLLVKYQKTKTKLFIKQAVRYLDIMNKLLHFFSVFLCVFIDIYI